MLYWSNRVFNRRNKINTIAYIDGQNFLYQIAERLLSAGLIADKQEVNAIDIPFLLNEVAPEEKIIMRYYGIKKISKWGKEDPDILEKSVRFANNFRILRNCLRNTGVEYRGTGILAVRNRDECKHCGAKDYKYQEKGVDVGLAVSIVEDVLERNVGHIVLVSSDTDLIPALKIAEKHNVPITYVACSDRVTKSLYSLATKTWVLRDIDIFEAYARSLKVV